MELESIHLLWNLVLTGIVAPFVWFIVQLHTETKRLEILLNRTREEMNRDFVSKEDLKRDMERMMDSLDNINKKIDDFFHDTVAYISYLQTDRIETGPVSIDK